MSSLRQRLSALHGVSLQADEGPTIAGDSLRQRLERLRLRRAGSEKLTSFQPLEVQLGGSWLEEGVLLVETRVSMGQRHGKRDLADLRTLQKVQDAPWGGPPERFLFLDTETTGLAGGTGTLVFLCGLGRLQGDGILIRQYLLAGPAAEARFLALLGREIGGGETLVSYNGLGFDRPLLAARFRLNRFPDLTEGQAHLDLLSYVRRAFRTSWPDCRLITAERLLLDFFRNSDISGAEAPESWLAYVRHGDGSRLSAVVRHNRWDLLSLAALLPRLREVYRYPESAGASAGAIARFLARGGDLESAYVLLARSEAILDVPGQLMLARLSRRRGDLSRTLRIWSRLAAQGNTSALEALAKHHEHQLGDWREAAAWAGQLPDGEHSRRRLERLQRKLERNPVLAPESPSSQQTRPLACERFRE